MGQLRGSLFVIVAAAGLAASPVLAEPVRAPELLAASSAAKPAHAPSFLLPTRRGTVSLDSLRGRVVVVDFWASWCGPCRHSFPWLASLHERYRAKGLTIVAINLDKRRADADRFLVELPAPFTVAFDPSGGTAETYKVKGMPSTYVVSSEGKLLYSHVGFDAKKSAEIEAIIQEALPQ
jgi:thiol-disulfide isomerase/thioredoxin